MLRLRHGLLTLSNGFSRTRVSSYRPITIWSEYLFFSHVNSVPSQSQFQLIHLTSSLSQRIYSTATVAIYGVYITSTLSCEREKLIKAPTILMRLTMKTQTFLWKRRLSKTVSKVVCFENVKKKNVNASFWERSVSSMDRWKRRHLKTVPRKTRHILSVVSISVFGRFRVDNRRNRIKKYTFSNDNKFV